MSKEVKEFYRRNSEWLRNCAENPDYPTVLRAMAQILIEEASGEGE